VLRVDESIAIEYVAVLVGDRKMNIKLRVNLVEVIRMAYLTKILLDL
jgi:hypothetical protein